MVLIQLAALSPNVPAFTNSHRPKRETRVEDLVGAGLSAESTSPKIHLADRGRSFRSVNAVLCNVGAFIKYASLLSGLVNNPWKYGLEFKLNNWPWKVIT